MNNEYKPIANQPNTFRLVEPTVAAERRVHEVMVAYPGVSLDERRGLCEVHGWNPEDKIPDLQGDVRISLDALRALLDREKEPEAQVKALHEIIKKRAGSYEKPKRLTSEEYWYELARALLEGFGNTQINKGDLNFREIQRAYKDFFGQ